MTDDGTESAMDPRETARGRPGGDESRARILVTAGELFAERGFNGVSTRELAKAANVNVSAIAYYFRGKKGLYRAVISQVIEDTQPFFAPVAERIRTGVAEAGNDRDALAKLVSWLIEALLSAVLNKDRMRWQMGLMLREFHQPSDGFQILLEQRIHPMHDAVARLVGAATGRGEKDPETLLLTCSLISQCMAFGAAQSVVCARLGWERYTPEAVGKVIETVRHVVLSMLDLDTSRPSSGSVRSC